jgi:hypothetical protein
MYVTVSNSIKRAATVHLATCVDLSAAGCILGRHHFLRTAKEG